MEQRLVTSWTLLAASQCPGEARRNGKAIREEGRALQKVRQGLCQLPPKTVVCCLLFVVCCMLYGADKADLEGALPEPKQTLPRAQANRQAKGVPFSQPPPFQKQGGDLQKTRENFSAGFRKACGMSAAFGPAFESSDSAKHQVPAAGGLRGLAAAGSEVEHAALSCCDVAAGQK